MRVLRIPGFASLLAGEAVNAIGNWVALIAVWGFAAFRFDAGAGDLALLFVVLSLPGAVLGPLLGVTIDRFGPRRMLIVANAVGFLDALALTQADSYEAVLVLALPLGLIEALGMASIDALPPRLVPDEHLVAANGLLGGAQDLAMVVGPVLAAVVNAWWGLAGAFAVDAATFLAALVVAVRLDAGAPVDVAQESPWQAARQGFRLAGRTPGLRWTLCVAAVTYGVWAVFGVLEPLYVRDVLHESDNVFALLQTAFGVGLVGAGLALARVGDRIARPRFVALATVASGCAAALYVATDVVAVAYVGVFLWGVDVAFFYVPAKTLLQRYTPMAAHGRILSLNQALEPMTALVAAPVAGALLGLMTVQQLGVGAGVVAAVAGVVALALSRHLPRPGPGAPVDPTAGTARDAIALGGPAPG